MHEVLYPFKMFVFILPRGNGALEARLWIKDFRSKQDRMPHAFDDDSAGENDQRSGERSASQ